MRFTSQTSSEGVTEHLFTLGEKNLHANPGKHADLPSFETHSALRFLTRHLVP